MTAEAACDTSVLVAALASWHEDHQTARTALRDAVTHIPVHVLLECFSVLTRLPAPHRIVPRDAADVIGRLSLAPIALPADAHQELIADLGGARVAGGAAYDALVGATARHHGLRLLTRDRRAQTTYDLLGVRYTLV